MILKNPNSRISVVNLLSDFILSKIPSNEETIINIVDCKNFFVIKGKTSYKELLDTPKIVDEFITKFSKHIGDYKVTHTIDLIEYDCKIKKSKEITLTYYNTSNCSYHPSQIDAFNTKKSSYIYNSFLKEITDDELTFTSEFPHGYSLNQGRLLYYYGKHIMYNIPSNYPVSTLTFNLSTDKDDDGDYKFSVINNNLNDKDDYLKSAILDVFNFDLSLIESEIKKVDWYNEILNPLEDYSFLKEKVKDFIII
jgi:hypothetical protein